MIPGRRSPLTTKTDAAAKQARVVTQRADGCSEGHSSFGNNPRGCFRGASGSLAARYLEVVHVDAARRVGPKLDPHALPLRPVNREALERDLDPDPAALQLRHADGVGSGRLAGGVNHGHAERLRRPRVPVQHKAERAPGLAILRQVVGVEWAELDRRPALLPRDAKRRGRMSLSETKLAISKVGELAGSFWEGLRTYFRYPMVIARATILGLWFGVLPAVGQSTAGLVAWADAMKSSKHPETFGKGEPA